jgi:uncharacterized protein (TIGR02145 family)
LPASRSLQSNSDIPGHADFITGFNDWRNPQNHNLWQGLGGVNNPCPHGFRLPTESEWAAELASWDTSDAAGAFASPLKLVVSAGFRTYFDGKVDGMGTTGSYWSSTVNGNFSRRFNYSFDGFSFDDYARAQGFSVRCIKD